jgi:hypothetical protein
VRARGEPGDGRAVPPIPRAARGEHGVPHQPVVAGARERGPVEAPPVRVLREGEQVVDPQRRLLRTRREAGIPRLRARAVPRADRLACVAAEHPAAETARHVAGDRAAPLDRPERDAPAGVHQPGLRDRARRTGRQARVARAAAVRVRSVGLEVEVREHRREDHPAPVLRRDEAAVLAHPPDARALRPRLLHHRRDVRGGEQAGPGRAGAEVPRERLELSLEDRVVVAAPRVPGHLAGARRRAGIVRAGVVGERERDDAPRTREETGGVQALRALGAEPDHVRLAAAREDAVERTGIERAGARDPAGREPGSPRGVLHGGAVEWLRHPPTLTARRARGIPAPSGRVPRHRRISRAVTVAAENWRYRSRPLR